MKELKRLNGHRHLIYFPLRSKKKTQTHTFCGVEPVQWYSCWYWLLWRFVISKIKLTFFYFLIFWRWLRSFFCFGILVFSVFFLHWLPNGMWYPMKRKIEEYDKNIAKEMESLRLSKLIWLDKLLNKKNENWLRLLETRKKKNIVTLNKRKISLQIVK